MSIDWSEFGKKQNIIKIKRQHDQKKKKDSTTQLPTQSMWYEMEKGVTQQTTRGKAEEHFKQVLVLVTVWLNWDQKQDEERSCTDQQGCSNSL